MKKVLLTVAMVFAASSAFAAAGNVSSTKHNLASTGTSSYKGTSDQVCKYCHVPHNPQINAPLWSRNGNPATVTAYTNAASMNATPSTTPGATTAMCLNCHNAAPVAQTVASISLGATISTSAQIGTDLTNDHPVSFLYDSALVAADGGGIVASPLPLFGASANQMECATCHAEVGS